MTTGESFKTKTRNGSTQDIGQLTGLFQSDVLASDHQGKARSGVDSIDFGIPGSGTAGGQNVDELWILMNLIEFESEVPAIGKTKNAVAWLTRLAFLGLFFQLFKGPENFILIAGWPAEFTIGA